MKKFLKILEIVLTILLICVLLWYLFSFIDIVIHNKPTSVDAFQYADWNLFIMFK